MNNIIISCVKLLESITDEPDSSSYITFGIDLDSCPASIENKVGVAVVGMAN